MKRLSRARRRDANEPAIVRALERCGAIVYRLDTGCDLLVYKRPVLRLLEVKNPAVRWKLTEDEERFAKRWPVVIVTTPKEALAAVGIEAVDVLRKSGAL